MYSLQKMSRPNWRKGQAPKDFSKESSKDSSKPKDLPLNSEKSELAIVPQAPQAFDADFSTNPHESTGSVFFDVCVEFTQACAEVWPKDELLAAKAEKLKGITGFSEKVTEGLRLAKLFHAEFNESYPLVVRKDPSFFAHPKLSAFHASAKYDSSPADVRDTVWEYIKSLVQYAGMVDMYSKCPQAMLESISGIANGLITKLQSGELDASNLNPIQLGQMMMQQMSSSDLEGFGNAIINGGNMDSMMSIMQSTLANMGGPNVPDMAMLSAMMKK